MPSAAVPVAERAAKYPPEISSRYTVGSGKISRSDAQVASKGYSVVKSRRGGNVNIKTTLKNVSGKRAEFDARRDIPRVVGAEMKTSDLRKSNVLLFSTLNCDYVDKPFSGRLILKTDGNKTENNLAKVSAIDQNRSVHDGEDSKDPTRSSRKETACRVNKDYCSLSSILNPGKNHGTLTENLSSVVKVGFPSDGMVENKSARRNGGGDETVGKSVPLSSTVISVNSASDATQKIEKLPPIPPRNKGFEGKSSVWGRLKARSCSTPSLIADAINIDVKQNCTDKQTKLGPLSVKMSNTELYENYFHSKIPKLTNAPVRLCNVDHIESLYSNVMVAKVTECGEKKKCSKNRWDAVLKKYEDLEKECAVSDLQFGINKEEELSPSNLEGKTERNYAFQIDNQKIPRIKNKDLVKDEIYPSDVNLKLDYASDSSLEDNKIDFKSIIRIGDSEMTEPIVVSANRNNFNIPQKCYSNKIMLEILGDGNVQDKVKDNVRNLKTLNNNAHNSYLMKDLIMTTQKNITDDCKNVNVKQLVLKTEKLSNKLAIMSNLNVNESNKFLKCKINGSDSELGKVYQHLRSLSTESQKSLYGLIHLYHSGGYYTNLSSAKSHAENSFLSFEKHIEDKTMCKRINGGGDNKSQTYQTTNKSSVTTGGIGIVRANTGRKISNCRYRTELEVCNLGLNFSTCVIFLVKFV